MISYFLHLKTSFKKSIHADSSDRFSGRGVSMDFLMFALWRKRHTLNPVRVIVSPVLSAKFGTT